ncbi:MAG: murein biosynthesis integral membrane protein MurJ [Nitrospirae bacterium]|nr:murein biosynthesis integral membrane protein MurJ [Nitrospirota bacterium]
MLKSTAAVSLATLISRILGLARDAIVAAVFPAGATDAFFVAWRIPNMFRAVLAEGAAQSAVVPVLNEVRRRSDEVVARFLGALLSAAVPLVVLLAVAGVVFSPQLVKLLAFGLKTDPGRFDLAVHLTRVVFPFIAIISIVSILMSIFQSYGRFFLPALTPAVLNIGLIAGAVGLSQFFARPIDGLAWGVLLGGGMQIALMVAASVRLAPPFKAVWEPGNEGVRRVAGLMSATVVGTAVYQLQVVVNTQLASFLETGSISALYYADRLIQFPLALVPTALATVTLPRLSTLAAAGEKRRMVEELDRSAVICLFLMIPAAVGLFLLREEAVRLVFQRREFGAGLAHETAAVLGVYAAGLWAFGLTRILSQGFYALQRPRLPVLVAAVALFVTAGVGVFAMNRWGVSGIASGTLAGALVQVVLLRRAWRRFQGEGAAVASLLGGGARILAASGFMAATLLALGRVPDGGHVLFAWGRLLLQVIVGAGVYMVAAHALHVDPAREAVARMKNRLRSRARPGA